MINYNSGTWGGLWSLFQAHGSVFPKATLVALPSAGLAMLVHYLTHEQQIIIVESDDITAGVIGGYTFILGLILSTRASKAYSRWWEGGTLLQQLRGEWFNAYSSLLAFTSVKLEMKEDVEKFQQVLARLMSLLYCSALQQVSTNPHVPSADYELIDTAGMDQEQLDFLEDVNDKVEVVLQWIQRLIVTNIGNGVLPIAPPIISRVFQEYSRGIVNLNNARKIADFPFPFPLVQMLSMMLSIHWLMIPISCGSSISNMVWAGVLTFLVVFSFWCIHFFSFELEMPFGSSSNHLPLIDMQSDMNRSLLTLLRRKAQFPPEFNCPHDVTVAPPTKTGLMKERPTWALATGRPGSSGSQRTSKRVDPASESPKIGAEPVLELKASGAWEPLAPPKTLADKDNPPSKDPAHGSSHSPPVISQTIQGQGGRIGGLSEDKGGGTTGAGGPGYPAGVAEPEPAGSTGPREPPGSGPRLPGATGASPS